MHIRDTSSVMKKALVCILANKCNFKKSFDEICCVEIVKYHLYLFLIYFFLQEQLLVLDWQEESVHL